MDIPIQLLLRWQSRTHRRSITALRGKEWLGYLVTNRVSVVSLLQEEIQRFVTAIVPANAAGQVGRVARRFALVAVAGELATRSKLTGWREGEAVHAARKCFVAWMDAFGGGGNREERAILAQVRAFFEMHGAAALKTSAPQLTSVFLNGQVFTGME